MSTQNTPVRVANENLSEITSAGVERALAARQAAGVELSSEQLEQVGGGLSIANRIIWAGGRIMDQIKQINLGNIANLGNQRF